MRLFKQSASSNAKDKLLVLKQFVGSDENPKFYLHLGSVDRVGINPQSKFKTPNAVCAYPFTDSVFHQLLENSLPFAKDRPYIHIISFNKPVKNLAEYSSEDLDKDIAFILKHKLLSQEEILDAAENNEVKSMAGEMWNITRMAAKGSNKWNALLRQMGYPAIYDPGFGILHRDEPKQIMIFETSGVIRVKTMINPYAGVEPHDLLDKQDKNQIKNIKRKNSPPDKTFIDRCNKILGTTEFNSIDLIDNADLIYSEFSNLEIKQLINHCYYHESNHLPLYILRVVYHDVYPVNEQFKDLLMLVNSYSDQKEFNKLMPISALVNVVQSIGNEGVGNLIAASDNNPDNKLLNLLKKIYKQGTSYKDILFKDLNKDSMSMLLVINPLQKISSEQKTLFNRLKPNDNLKSQFAADEDSFEKCGGSTYLSYVSRIKFLNDCITYMNIMDQYPGNTGFRDADMVNILNDNEWLRDRLTTSVLFFHMLGGPEHLHSKNKIKMFIENYIEDYTAS